jgi:hypothetical protein
VNDNATMIAAIVAVLAVLLVTALGFRLAMARWLPRPDGEIRPAHTVLGCGLFAIGAGLIFGWLAFLQVEQPNTLYAVAAGFGALGTWLVLRWARVRVWIEADALRVRPFLGSERRIVWAVVSGVRGRYWRDQWVIESVQGRPFTLSCKLEGVEALLEEAWARGIALRDFEPFMKAGKLILPKRP